MDFDTKSNVFINLVFCIKNIIFVVKDHKMIYAGPADVFKNKKVKL